MNKVTLVLLALAFAATGCSKDHDLDDYKQEQFQKYYAKVAAVSGRYSGSLKSAHSGAVLSALQITLRPTATTSSSSDQSSDPIKPGLSAEIEFAGTSARTKVTAEQESYSDQGHLFHAILPPIVELGVGTPSVQIDINGTIDDDGSFNGTMAVNGFEDEGGVFSLAKDGSNLDQLAQTLALGPESVFASTDQSIAHVYEGTYTDSQGTLPAELTVSTPPRTRLQEIADLLNPSREKFYTLNFKENGNYSIDFQLAEYDAGEKALKAQQTKALQSGSVNANFSITCNRFTFAQTNYNFTCSYTSSLLAGGARLEFHSP